MMEGLIWVFVFLALLFVPSWLFYIIFVVAVFMVFAFVSNLSREAGFGAALMFILYGIIMWFIRFGIHHLIWHW